MATKQFAEAIKPPQSKEFGEIHAICPVLTLYASVNRLTHLAKARAISNPSFILRHVGYPFSFSYIR